MKEPCEDEWQGAGEAVGGSLPAGRSGSGVWGSSAGAVHLIVASLSCLLCLPQQPLQGQFRAGPDGCNPTAHCGALQLYPGDAMSAKTA